MQPPAAKPLIMTRKRKSVAAKKVLKPKQLAMTVEQRCQEFISKLRKIRETRGITVAILSDTTGIAQPNITRMEQFASTPNLKTLFKLTEALGVDVILKERPN